MPFVTSSHKGARPKLASPWTWVQSCDSLWLQPCDGLWLTEWIRSDGVLRRRLSRPHVFRSSPCLCHHYEISMFQAAYWHQEDKERHGANLSQLLQPQVTHRPTWRIRTVSLNTHNLIYEAIINVFSATEL